MHVILKGKLCEVYFCFSNLVIDVFFVSAIILKSYFLNDQRFWVLGLEIEQNGILLVTDYNGRSSGEAFVQFTNTGDGKKALQKHKDLIGSRWGSLLSF